MIDRQKLAADIQKEKKLRKLVRKGIKITLERKEKEAKKQKLYETKLRKIIRQLISEVSTDVTSEIPHKNTGINVLEELLKKIIPILEDDFKALTSNEEQRISFRAHILNAIKNSLAPVDALRKAAAGEEATLSEEEVDIAVSPPEEEKFIPVRTADLPDTDEEEEDTFSIPGEDETGRNFAQQSFNKVENQILDAYASLQAEEDKELFYDYLITNVKLYFDKFEDELKTSLEEPTTKEYEAQTAAADAEAGEPLEAEILGL